ncbi:hypothetical protein ABVK25_004888 [Lepraria finkii]|uniref:Secreted protein n=1 Tax=Lepraria finkii TaxID=1340010 RepID=A0ABR4BCM7_9LECA
MATALPSSWLVLLIDAPLLKGDGAGGGTGVPDGDPGAEPTGSGTLVPFAKTTEEAVVGNGAALVLYTMLVAADGDDDTGVDTAVDNGTGVDEEAGAVEMMTAVVVGMRM